MISEVMFNVKGIDLTHLKLGNLGLGSFNEGRGVFSNIFGANNDFTDGTVRRGFEHEVAHEGFEDHP